MKRIGFTVLFNIAMLAMLAGCAPGTGVQVNTPVPAPKGGTPPASGAINVPGVSININAPAPDQFFNTPAGNGRVAGILMGIWHGVISPVTIVLSFVRKDSQMYELHNDGGPYNLGFVLGVILLLVILGLLLGFRR